MDVEAMAARFSDHQDLYKKIRDEGFDYFASTHPKPASVEPMKTIIRIWAYEWVWGDRYYEDMDYQSYSCALQVMNTGQVDWLANMVFEMEKMTGPYPSNVKSMERKSFSLSKLLSTGYPAPFKIRGAAWLIEAMSDYKREAHADPAAPTFLMLPVALEAWGNGYRKLIQDKWPHNLLFAPASNLQCYLQQDEPTLNLVIAEIDEDYNETDPDSPVKVALDGEYFTNAAWCARGSDWASTVTEPGWKVFAERLTKADTILEAGFAKYPQEGEMAVAMIDVELGQGQGRERMEAWFQKAIELNPNDCSAYCAKEYYLQPKWYGSIEDLLAFGKEAEKTGRWDSMIAMTLALGISIDSQNDGAVYRREDVWPALEENYRSFLKRYPDARGMRTAFAKHAIAGGHMDVAREQLKILGRNWSRDQLDDVEYYMMKRKVGL